MTMKRKISKDDLTQVLAISFHPSLAITAAALAQGLMALANYSACPVEMGGNGMKDEIGTMGDRWYGGCLLLGLAMAEVVDDLCEYEGGVFTYDCVEVDEPLGTAGVSNLSYWLMHAVEPLAWYHISENWHQPSKEALTEVFREWAEQAGVKVKEAV
jgi:hypothetical protein